MSAALIARQRALLEALLGRADASSIGLLGLPGVRDEQGGAAAQRGLRAYRLNAQVLAAKTLGAVFGRIQQVLGDESFAAMAWSFWRRSPPERGDLGLWGERLPEFLAGQDSMDLWLCDLARLEWAAHIAERAADSELDAASLTLLSEQEPERLSLRMRPGLQLLRVQSTAWALWSGSDDAEDDAEDCGATVTVVMARKAWRAEGFCLPLGASALMDALLGGANLDQAVQQAFVAEADFDFSAWLQSALLNGWLQGAEHRI
ncbi:DNA-binding domain-containing protein [Roseateles oligotrophus]|uniref:DNA-binding domain-containing protein n=1 Tax=Roseateles oligotrophus TaxID=1769250 RepID=A0ABT2YFH9_9BURK|nr:DNA-binding domain-containing protein [Roseateles oligotrophus]MCV2368805.1 DNA-binding domain-containing protein [Roseateles oligotrophus]